MTNFEVMQNHLREASDSCDSIKDPRSEPAFINKIKFTFVLHCVRAICYAILEVASAIKDSNYGG